MGPGRLVDPEHLAHIYVSPRQRARKTFELFLPSGTPATLKHCVTYTENIAEWDYGKYEGLKEDEIRGLRKREGLDHAREWDIWRDGCEEGELVKDQFIVLSKR